MKVSIIIPNYNGEELLRKNLPKVFEAVEYYVKKTNNEVGVIIVDDCSTDFSLEEIQNAKIKSQNYKVKFKSITNESNLGFSSTVNRGVGESEGEIIVLLNTDVAPQKDFLESLIEHFKNDKVFAVGCMDKSIEGEKIILRGRGIGLWKRGFLVHARGEVDKTNTLWVSGGSGAFRKSIWDRLGGFNELYSPFYWEDIDISYRALKSGYHILFEPKSVVLHEHEKGAIKAKYSQFKIKTIAYRNQIIFTWNNATDYDLLISHLFWLPYYIVRALLQFDLPFIVGFFQALLLLPGIISARNNLQLSFIKTDKQVMQLVL